MGTIFSSTNSLTINSDMVSMDEYGHRLTASLLHLSTTLPANSTHKDTLRAEITPNHQVVNIVVSNPEALISNISWETKEQCISFDYTLVSDTSVSIQCDLILMKSI